MKVSITFEPGAVFGRPCPYCVADAWAYAEQAGCAYEVVAPKPDDCEFRHRDDQRVYDLARALAAAVCVERHPTDAQIAWSLEDADEVVDDFDPAPSRWSVRRLRPGANDEIRGIEIRLRINGVSYVGLEGGKDERGALLPLAEFRAGERRVS